MYELPDLQESNKKNKHILSKNIMVQISKIKVKINKNMIT
jgi:hypothetical protein